MYDSLYAQRDVPQLRVAQHDGKNTFFLSQFKNQWKKNNFIDINIDIDNVMTLPLACDEGKSPSIFRCRPFRIWYRHAGYIQLKQI